MRIISWNVNGLRAVYQKEFLAQLKDFKAEIVCFQEIKLQKHQLPDAQKKGYSGVAVYSQKKPLTVETNIGLERFDCEGRMLKLDYGEFTLINLYLPHGGRQKENLDYKLAVYDYLLAYLRRIKNKKVILIGDFNIAHQEIDLARPKQNQHNVMFTPEERKKIEQLIKLGFIDTFRKFHKQSDQYTWWPYFAQARERNLGWRIDYAFVSPPLIASLKKAFILKEVEGSDHCPIGVELTLIF